MTNSKVRIGGSGFTVMSFQGTRLAYLQEIGDRSPQPVAPAEEIQPMDEPVPIEIVTAQAVKGGVLTLRFFELWNAPAWQQMPGFDGTNNLLDVLRRQLSLGEITCRKIIKSPTGSFRTRVYHGCVITDVNEAETIAIQNLSVAKTIQIAYTHTTNI